MPVDGDRSSDRHGASRRGWYRSGLDRRHRRRRHRRHRHRRIDGYRRWHPRGRDWGRNQWRRRRSCGRHTARDRGRGDPTLRGGWTSRGRSRGRLALAARAKRCLVVVVIPDEPFSASGASDDHRRVHPQGEERDRPTLVHTDARGVLFIQEGPLSSTRRSPTHPNAPSRVVCRATMHDSRGTSDPDGKEVDHSQAGV